MSKPRKSPFSRPYEEIIRRLISRRKDIGITQVELGAAFGENQSFISSIERRQRRIDVYEFVRLCRILQIEPGEILAGLPDED